MKILTLTIAILISLPLYAQENIATLRQDVPIGQEGQPRSMAKVINDDIKRKRNYPMQPPTIPHSIDNYQVDLNTNKCMSCHSRKLSEDTGAPMVSVTHYMDRDGNFLASVSPRRYFCSQCHVVQTDAKPHVASNFVDLDELIAPQQGKE